MAAQTFSATIYLNQVANWDGNPKTINKLLADAFGAEDYTECIKDLGAHGIRPISYIDSLDRIIDILPVDSELRKRCIRALRKTCGLHGTLPTSYTFGHSLSKSGSRPHASGGFSDVWRYTDANNHNMAFAVKSLRVYEQDPIDKIRKKYCKEVIVCRRAQHPNILSIEGVDQKLFEFCMVAQWMENGSILSYVTKYPGANRLELLIGITRGLGYLHGNEVIHGDLKSPNILIDSKGSPRLSDFGLCSITRNIDSVNASTPNHGCTVRYCAPELLDTDSRVVKTKKEKKPTYKSDVYSLAMVIVELVTGKMPFPNATDYNVTVMISRGKRPQKPSRFDAPGISSAVWKVAKKCWDEKAKDRPEVHEVLQRLEKISNPGEEPSPPPTFSRILREFFGYD